MREAMVRSKVIVIEKDENREPRFENRKSAENREWRTVKGSE